MNSHLQYIKKLSVDFLILLISYQILRFLFFVHNLSHFPDIDLAGYFYIIKGGLRFDIAVLIYINIIYILGYIIPFTFRENSWYKKTFLFIFIISNGLGVLVNVIDVAYFPFTFHRTSATFFFEFQNDKHLLSEIPMLIKSYWFLFFYFILIIYLLFKTVNRKEKFIPTENNKAKYYLVHSSIFILTCILCLIGIRGTFNLESRPINVGYAGEYVNKPAEVNIVLNTPFSILFTFGTNQLPQKNYFTSQLELEKNFNPQRNYQGKVKRKSNVVIIIVESLSREFVGGLNKQYKDYVSYTPFLDSLIPYSYTSSLSFANGRKSIEALPAIIASIPTLNESYVVTPYGGNSFKSLAHVLKTEGYASSFYHGGHRGSMGFWAFMKLAGFDKYYDLENFNNNDFYDGNWGIWDEEFLQYWAGQLNKEKKPFLSVLFTVSSHHPYAIPEKYKNVFNRSEIKIQNSISYTDHALKLFFNSIKNENWYNNSLFIITSDHTATLNYYPTYQGEVGNYASAVIFYTPDHSLKPKMLKKPIQQSDIFPSVVDYLGLKDTIVTFGTSVFDTLNFSKHPVVLCRNGLYQIIVDSLVLQYDGNKEKVIGLYNYSRSNFSDNLIDNNKELADRNLLILKAYVQQYTDRVRNNKLLPK